MFKLGAMTSTHIATDPLLTIDELGTAADARWSELDRARRIPQDLYDAAAGAGLFRQLVAPGVGGRGRSPLEWFRTGMGLARHEPSFAWVVTQGAAELGWIAAGADPAWAAEVLADPLGSSASTVAGFGRLAVDGDRARFGGRWAFNTGCTNATWTGGLALVEGQRTDDGLPVVRWAWVPAARATVVEDWDPIGMRGTGSHTTVIDEQDIPMAWTFNPYEPTRNARGAYRVLVGNGNWPIATSVAAVQLGNARRALDEARTVIASKAPPPDFVRLVDSGAVQRQLVEAEGLWSAGVAVVERELDSMWAEAALLEELSRDTRVALHRANITADRLATRAVELACELSGTAWLAPGAVLGRCRRDALALHGHVSVNGMSAEHNAKADLGSMPATLLV